MKKTTAITLLLISAMSISSCTNDQTLEELEKINENNKKVQKIFISPSKTGEPGDDMSGSEEG